MDSHGFPWPPEIVRLGLLCMAYAVAVVCLLREKRAATNAAAAAALPPLPFLPADDRPPAAAVGWPPEGPSFTLYVDEGGAAIDAYLSEGYAP